MSWVNVISTLNNQAQGYVLVTVLATKGSSPRDTGTKMVVSADESFDTIGGGALEFQCIDIARQLLSDNSTSTQYTQTFNLGKDLKQCCGGVVEVFFEVFPACQFKIILFGAGHIGKSLVKILEEVDCQVKWFDARPELFPQNPASHIQILNLDEPEIAVEACHPDSYYLIMTHDHALDQQLVEAVLSRGDSRYCGLIGSSTKGLKFRQRLMRKGYVEKELNLLSCPVGLSSLTSKRPMEIAVSISAKLLQLRDNQIQITHESDSEILQFEKKE